MRLQSGKTAVLNGPFVETREQLGGYFLIDVPDLDAALTDWPKHGVRNPPTPGC